jgi:hypothetical protein
MHPDHIEVGIAHMTRKPKMDKQLSKQLLNKTHLLSKLHQSVTHVTKISAKL